MARPALLGGRPVFSSRHAWPAWPQHTKSDERRLIEALRDGRWGIGCPVIDHFGDALREHSAARYALPVSSGTAALTLILKAIGVGPDSEVIVPAYTFVASATCALDLGATVVFADVDPATSNLDIQSVARLVSPRTAAVIAVHFAGNPVDLHALRRELKKQGRDVPIIEDAAHAHGMLYRGKAPGHYSVAAAYSYQSTKNMAAGEGGAIVTNRRPIYEAAWSCHSFGRKFGHEWYGHYMLAWNYRMTGLQASLLLGQLERLEEQTQRRSKNAELLDDMLAQLPGQSPQVEEATGKGNRRVHHLYCWRHLAKQAGLKRDTFIRALQAEGVPANGGYGEPLPSQPMFRQRRFWHEQGIQTKPGKPRRKEPKYTSTGLPGAKQLCREAMWLPHEILLADSNHIERIGGAVGKILKHADALRGTEKGG